MMDWLSVLGSYSYTVLFGFFGVFLLFLSISALLESRHTRHRKGEDGDRSLWETLGMGLSLVLFAAAFWLDARFGDETTAGLVALPGLILFFWILKGHRSRG